MLTTNRLAQNGLRTSKTVRRRLDDCTSPQSAMLPLFGEERRRREINLGGRSSAASHAAILDQAKARRNERLHTRQRQDSAIKLQAWWRGLLESWKVRADLRRAFDEDVLGINGLRCLALIGKDEERLGRWATSVLNGGEGMLQS